MLPTLGGQSATSASRSALSEAHLPYLGSNRPGRRSAAHALGRDGSPPVLLVAPSLPEAARFGFLLPANPCALFLQPTTHSVCV